MGRKKKGQLPSGNIRIQRKVGTNPDGSRILKSFTGRTRDEAEYKYRQYMLSPSRPIGNASLEIRSAVSRYIDVKTGVLSPATIRGYRGVLRDYIDREPIGKIDVNAITSKDAQAWISTLSARISPKSVRNAWSLLLSSLEMFTDVRLKVTLPQKIPAVLYCPSDADVQAVLKLVSKDHELEKAVLLAAFGPMRRSEICALNYEDINGTFVRVNKALVQDESKMWVIKTTKTVGSIREIEYPDFVIEKLGSGTGRVVNIHPNQVTVRFGRALRAAGVRPFRFHDLRSYAVSIMHAIGIADQYIMARGGWSTPSVMIRAYRRSIDDEARKQNAKINDHFSALSHV